MVVVLSGLAADSNSASFLAPQRAAIYAGGPYGGATPAPTRADTNESNDRRMDPAAVEQANIAEACGKSRSPTGLRGLVGPKALFAHLCKITA